MNIKIFDAITHNRFVSVNVYERSRQIVILSLIDKEIEVIEITSYTAIRVRSGHHKNGFNKS